MDVVEFLKRVPLLSGLPGEALDGLAGAVRERQCAAGEVIIREGDEDDVLYIVVQGTVEVVKGYGTPQQERIAERRRREVIGEMRLLENVPRFATCVARGPVVVLAIPYPPFIEFATRNPVVLGRLGAIMSGKARQARGDLYAELVRKHQETAALADFQRAVLRGLVAHELRTPIANLALTLELAQRVGPAGFSAEQLQQTFADLGRNTRLIRQRVDSLVDYIALASEQSEMFPQALDFVALARQVARELEPQAAAAGVTLEQKMAVPSLPLRGDRRLADAMAHLLDNAVKFNRRGGRAVVVVWREGDTARYEVVDSGVGIPADRLEHLWEPFTQMADVLRRGLEGLGLGLALTRYIARAHGGDVWAESEEGRGSKFGFWVPVREA